MTDANPKPSDRSVLLWATVLTIVFEVITCVVRFGMKLESTKDTASTIGRLTCGIRIHHSYIGALMILVSCGMWKSKPNAAWWMLVIGLGLFFSDLIHHFLVLWPILGSPQFDLVY